MSLATKSFSQESIFLPVSSEGDELHLRHFKPIDNTKGIIFLLHGAIENGRIFYSNNGDKGLAPFLAQSGFEVFVGDLRGRGKSRPHISASSSYGQTEAIVEDLRVMADHMSQVAAGRPQHWIAHSWGGVLLASHLLRFPERIKSIESLTFFGTKRSVAAINLKRFVGIDIVWNRASKLATLIYGYLPGKKLNLGSDDETKRSHAHSVAWVKNTREWIDPVDGFDYGAATRSIKLPRTLSLAGIKDAYLGNPKDVRRFLKECYLPDDSFLLLSKKNGNLKDYGHIDMLTATEALSDHFPLVCNWLTKI
ncbi:MAG: alpha/beta hydrolase [Proteobacteria bacterium]|nr:MAG: alpha/beta hydrolase [Pseudomonadota bacterium]